MALNRKLLPAMIPTLTLLMDDHQKHEPRTEEHGPQNTQPRERYEVRVDGEKHESPRDGGEQYGK